MWVEFYFRQGQLVCIGPMRANVTLIDRLLQAKLLSAQVLPQVRQIIGPSEVNETRIALTLINEGYLNREILRAWSAHETSQILQAIFSWPTGEIYFEDDRSTPADRLLIALSVSTLLEALPAASAYRAAAASAPSTDELPHTPPSIAHVISSPVQLLNMGPSGQMPGDLPLTPPAQGLLDASQLIEPSFAFSQQEPPRSEEGRVNTAQLIDELPFKSVSMGGSGNATRLLEDMVPPSFAGAQSSVMFKPETVDISVSTQISILPPQPVRNPLPPTRIDTSFMTPELVLAPVDLSTLRERNPQVQLTPDQWSLFALVDGQTSLQTLCQMLSAPAEQVCMVAGELMAIGLVMPLHPTTGALSELMSPAMAPAMSPSAQYPVYTSQSMISLPNAFASSMEMQSQRGSSRSGSPLPSASNLQGMVGKRGQSGSAYAPVGGYR